MQKYECSVIYTLFSNLVFEKARPQRQQFLCTQNPTGDIFYPFPPKHPTTNTLHIKISETPTFI